MSALSELLNKAIAEQYGDKSNRDLAKLAGISRGSVDNYRNGAVLRPTDDVLQAFHRLLAIPIQELRLAAGLPRGEAEPYAPPSEANLLDGRQRRAIDELIRSIVITDGVAYVGSTAEQGASSAPGEGQKTEGDLVADQSKDGPGGVAAKRLSGRMSRRVREASEQQREVE